MHSNVYKELVEVRLHDFVYRYQKYVIGNGLTLMNIVLKNENGKMCEVHSYIGQEGNGFACVGHTEGLDEPGVIFSYAGYVRMLEANLPALLDCFYTNIQ
jgi:hypothetical protein